MKRLAVPLSLGLVAALLVVAILLAASVERVTFTSGQPFDETLGTRRDVQIGGRDPGPVGPFDYAVSYALGAAMLVVIVLYLRRSAGREGAPRRKGGRWPALVTVAVIIGATTFVFLYQMSPSEDEEDAAASEFAASDSVADRRAPAPFTQVDELMGTGGDDTGAEGVPAVRVIAGVLAGVTGAVGAFLVARLVRRRSAAAEEPPEELLAPVRAAVAELRLGRDARGVVEQCYRQMMRALADRSKVDPACLTPREFVAALAGAGLDGAPIGELSTLFEEVHYGHRSEESLAPRALLCMTAITEFYPASEASP